MNKPNPVSWSHQIGKRWRLLEAFDECGDEIVDVMQLMVGTPRGTGPSAGSACFVPKEEMGKYPSNRRVLAFHIRSLRFAASEFRKTHKHPE